MGELCYDVVSAPESDLAYIPAGSTYLALIDAAAMTMSRGACIVLVRAANGRCGGSDHTIWQAAHHRGKCHLWVQTMLLGQAPLTTDND